MQRPSDASRREALVRLVQARASSARATSEVLVSLEEFFDGNSDLGSIGCNLTRHPGPQKFAFVLRTIRDRSDVQSVLVAISDLCEDDVDSWPFSDRVFIIASATQNDVKGWVGDLAPDEVASLELSQWPEGFPDVHPGYLPFRIWWD